MLHHFLIQVEALNLEKLVWRSLYFCAILITSMISNQNHVVGVTSVEPANNNDLH